MNRPLLTGGFPILMGVCLALLAPETLLGQAADTGTVRHDWVNISDPVVNRLTENGKKLDWPGQTAGVIVDPSNGDVYMVVTGSGLWKSTDQGASFTRCDGGHVTGRCETAYSLNFDPAGGRLACFMLDGKCGMSLDAGKTWQGFADVGRNWDYAAVDWSAKNPTTILALRHESGGELYLSKDAGKSWRKIATDPKFSAVGVIDEKTLLCSKGDGILRSTDDGATWAKVSDQTPLGRVMCLYKGRAWWLGARGLLLSKDAGTTWETIGSPVDASSGPYFKDGEHIVVAGKHGLFKTIDGGKTWTPVAAIPPHFDVPQPGWFSNLRWDPIHDLFYASKMGLPTFKLQGR